MIIINNLEYLDSWDSNWTKLKVLIIGLGITGISCAKTLHELGAQVSIYSKTNIDTLTILKSINYSFKNEKLILKEISEKMYDLVIASPGYSPEHNIISLAKQYKIPIWGDIELAWRLRKRKDRKISKWILITGTNGKTTTSEMLKSIFNYANISSTTVGNIGNPILNDINKSYDMLIIEISSFQLYYTHTIAPEVSIVLNFAPDHIDWHGSELAYYKAKEKIYSRTKIVSIYNADDKKTVNMINNSKPVNNSKFIGFTIGIPSPGEIGIVENIICDRAFSKNTKEEAAEICNFNDLGKPLNMSIIKNAAAAIALARSFNVKSSDIKLGLRNYKRTSHRIEHIKTHNDIVWINDSKATNAHATSMALSIFDNIIWIAGGLSKGIRYDELIIKYKDRIKSIILIGKDQEPLRQVLKENASEICVYITTSVECEQIMPEVVKIASKIAKKGDTILLSPAASSIDQFESYQERGIRFIEAVKNI